MHLVLGFIVIALFVGIVYLVHRHTRAAVAAIVPTAEETLENDAAKADAYTAAALKASEARGRAFVAAVEKEAKAAAAKL